MFGKAIQAFGRYPLVRGYRWLASPAHPVNNLDVVCETVAERLSNPVSRTKSGLLRAIYS